MLKTRVKELQWGCAGDCEEMASSSGVLGMLHKLK